MAMFDQDGRDPNELIKQHGDEARELFRRNYFGEGAPRIQAVDMKHVDFGGHSVEFVVKGEDLIFHFFRSDGDPWPNDFRSRMWNAFITSFKLQDFSERVVIDWVPELYSWCVTIKKLALVSPPEDEVVLAALQNV